MQIISEGAGNSTATVVKPNGVAMEVRLIDGQGFVEADMAGLWAVRQGGKEKIVRVEDGFAAKEEAGAQGPDFFRAALFAILFTSVAIAGAYSAWYFFVREPAPAHRVHFQKSRNGKMVSVLLRAGKDPLENIEIIDVSDGRKIVTKRKRLAAHEEMAFSYEHEGEHAHDLAKARFLLHGKIIMIEAGDGAEGGIPVEQQKESHAEPKKKLKLARAK